LPALVAARPASAGDHEHGRVIAARCAACHGPLAVPSSPMIPRLAGQSGDYLFEQRQRFKEGVRVSPVMSPAAESLTALEMSDVARRGWTRYRRPRGNNRATSRKALYITRTGRRA
jgi:cytochrome c553